LRRQQGEQGFSGIQTWREGGRGWTEGKPRHAALRGFGLRLQPRPPSRIMTWQYRHAQRARPFHLASCRAVTVVVIPPRGVKAAVSVIERG
jgi:hypothetical protein